MVGLIIVAVGTNGAFLIDLGRPERFWRVFLRPLSSWISRGVFLITSLLFFGVLSLAPHWVGVPWGTDSGLGRAFLGIGMAAALGVMMYTGFVLSYSPAIPFWNTSLLPILVVLYALMGSNAAIFAMAYTLSGLNMMLMEQVEIGLILTSLVMLFVYLTTVSYSTVAAKKSVAMLVRGELAGLFLGGVVLVGLLVPLGVALAIYWGEVSANVASPLLAVAGLVELGGGFIFRYCLLRAGVYLAPM